MNKFIYDLETKINKKPSKYILGLFILVAVSYTHLTLPTTSRV